MGKRIPHGNRLDQMFDGVDEDYGSEPMREGTATNSPAEMGDDLFVKLTIADSDYVIGPVPYMSIPKNKHGELPEEGDRVLVATSDTGQQWVVAWWSYG
jgi:hypothetical protein